MSRYSYNRIWRHEPTYRVKFREVEIGIVRCMSGIYGDRWHAVLFTDPTTTGEGKTRDQAVDDAYRQVGGPG